MGMWSPAVHADAKQSSSVFKEEMRQRGGGRGGVLQTLYAQSPQWPGSKTKSS